MSGTADKPATPGEAARRLFGFLEATFWNGRTLEGPDPGIRFNTRVGRFVKSYLGVIPWRDHLVYQQAQGYWIIDNWMLWRSSGDSRHRDIALAAAEGVLESQTAEGYWEYPNPEWKGRIATVEGCFAALGLLTSFDATGDARFLQAAVRWYQFMETEIGYRRQRDPSMLAINYFRVSSSEPGGVPNNSTLLLWLSARLWQATGDDAFLGTAPNLIAWLADVQLGTGELPYRLGRVSSDDTIHFLCHQYNAFEFMDLVEYRRITGDDSISEVIERLAGFLPTGVTDDLHAAYDCDDRRTTVLYYDLALAQALHQATQLGLGDHERTVSAMYRRVISSQRPDGRFRYHSKRNYGVLRDARSYPRYLSMMLFHLLLAAEEDIET